MELGGVIKLGVSWCAPWAVAVSGPRCLPARVAMTFDDGPHPENTPRILDVLGSERIKATFFLQGNLVEQYPALVRNIVAQGHQVANHGYSHCDAKTISTRDYVAEVLRTQALLENVVGGPVSRCFRPPFGAITFSTFIALVRQRFRFVFWSFDSQDSFITDANALYDYIAAQQVRPGSILLFHDDYMQTVAALPYVVAYLRGSGLSFVSVDELLG